MKIPKYFYFRVRVKGNHRGKAEIEVEDASNEDVVEVVRCKDCKNWDKTWTNDYAPNYHYCPMVDGVRKDDFYCADGERREAE